MPVAAALLMLATTHPLKGERANDGQPSPSPEGHLAGGALAPPRTGVAARHPCIDAGPVDEDQAVRLDPRQRGAPRHPLPDDVLTLLRGGPGCPFFRTSPSAWSARHTAARLRRTPERSAGRSACSASVASFCSATSLARTFASPPSSGKPPAAGLAARRPARAAFGQPEAVRSPT